MTMTATDILDPVVQATPTTHEKKTWSELQALQRPDEKRLMARHCAEHDFLVSPGSNPETAPREKLASILANNGTSPELGVKECLEWVVSNYGTRGPFDLTWYTTGTLIPATLKEFRDMYPHMATAMHLFLFPGRVDQQMEAVSGPDPVDFADSMHRCFRYAFLSAHSFDMSTGTAYFHLPEEVRLQKAVATRYAAHKFLFLDSGKFKREGEIGYHMHELLQQAKTATIYTVTTSPASDARLKREFLELCNDTFKPDTVTAGTDAGSRKRELRLVIVGRDNTPTDRTSIKEGLLKQEDA